MTLTRGYLVTLVSGAIGALMGAGLGYFVGLFMPDYYRTVFSMPTGEEPDFIELGIGLGMLQGLGAGLAIGVALCGIVAWYNSRVKRLEQVDGMTERN